MYYLCTSSMPPQANDTMCLVVGLLNLKAWRLGGRERERERERVCVCNVHMISTKSFHIPTFVCFTTVDIPGIPSHYTHHPCTRFHMLGHTVKLEELQPLHTVNTTSKDLLLMVLLP